MLHLLLFICKYAVWISDAEQSRYYLLNFDGWIDSCRFKGWRCFQFVHWRAWDGQQIHFTCCIICFVPADLCIQIVQAFILIVCWQRWFHCKLRKIVTCVVLYYVVLSVKHFYRFTEIIYSVKDFLFSYMIHINKLENKIQV